MFGAIGGFLVFIIIAVIILFILSSCIRIVPQAQALVVERLGAYPVSYTHLLRAFCRLWSTAAVVSISVLSISNTICGYLIGTSLSETMVDGMDLARFRNAFGPRQTVRFHNPPGNCGTVQWPAGPWPA